MPLGPGDALVRGLLPEDGAGLLVEREQLPDVGRAVVHGIGVAEQAGPQRLLGIARYGGGDEDPISPDHRRRHGEAGNRRLPDDVRALGGIPAQRRLIAIADAGRGRSAKLGPIAGHRGDGGEQDGGKQSHCGATLLYLNSLPICFRVKVVADVNSTSSFAAAYSKMVGLFAFGRNSGWPAACMYSLPSFRKILISRGNCSEW